MTDIGNTRGIARACAAGSAVRAVAANVSALLFAPFARLYGFCFYLRRENILCKDERFTAFFEKDQ